MPNKTGINGYIPSPPDALIRPLVEDMVRRGFKNRAIVDELYNSGVFDTEKYSFGLAVLRKKRSQWKLFSARGQAHTVECIGPAIERLRTKHSAIGAQQMKQLLLEEEEMSVAKKLILEYMNLHHPDEVEARRRKPPPKRPRR